MNLPNALTILRFFLVVIFVYVFFMPNYFLAIMVLIAAGLTDLLDGYIARKYDLITNWGKLMDPLADKVLLVTVLACLYFRKMIPIAVIVIIFLKEIIMVLGAAFLYKYRKTVVSSNIYGKAATAIFYVAIILTFLEDLVSPLHKIVMFIAVAMAVYACCQYAMNFFAKK
ncbi:MAG: CDP-alcohol phosphatidyltransferase family protein [Clostridia bacterium]|jgi:cardiolipin synthase